jgi:segregation and condensation protein A
LEIAASVDAPPAKVTSKFDVHLEVFAGPFEVMLSLISKHKLDVTHIALSVITDEFVAYVKSISDDENQLEEMSSFILIAATLLEIKTARLLPGQENLGEEDLELLEARDVLFAKLLQYKAFKDVGLQFGEMMEHANLRTPRATPLEEKFAKMLPELRFDTDTRQLALLGAEVWASYMLRNQGVSLEHIHMRQVNVASQGIIISKMLKKSGTLLFSDLIKDAKHAVIIIGRFLSLLELYKMGAVTFSQRTALGDLTVKWTAPEDFNPEARLQGSDFDTPVEGVSEDASEKITVDARKTTPMKAPRKKPERTPEKKPNEKVENKPEERAVE